MEKSFKHNYSPSDIALLFGIKRQKECPILNDWLAANYELNDLEQSLFYQGFSNAAENIDYWNEEELKIRLVGLLFLIANIEQNNSIKVFYERTIAGKVDGVDLSVKSDCFVATSSDFNAPLHPYFFLQEFKKMRGEKKDPEGQMLAAMLISQSLNQDDMPVYGGYMIGSNWWFTTLVDRTYCSSQKFDTTKQSDLLQIIFILRKLKELIGRRSVGRRSVLNR